MLWLAGLWVICISLFSLEEIFLSMLPCHFIINNGLEHTLSQTFFSIQKHYLSLLHPLFLLLWYYYAMTSLHWVCSHVAFCAGEVSAGMHGWRKKTFFFLGRRTRSNENGQNTREDKGGLPCYFFIWILQFLSLSQKNTSWPCRVLPARMSIY